MRYPKKNSAAIPSDMTEQKPVLLVGKGIEKYQNGIVECNAFTEKKNNRRILKKETGGIKKKAISFMYVSDLMT